MARIGYKTPTIWVFPTLHSGGQDHNWPTKGWMATLPPLGSPKPQGEVPNQKWPQRARIGYITPTI